MATKDETEIFLPIHYKDYKENKINLLKTSLKAVKTVERIKRMNEIRKIKSQQRRLLLKIIREYKKDYAKLIKALPTKKEVKIPKK
jgi:hypothetical protein